MKYHSLAFKLTYRIVAIIILIMIAISAVVSSSLSKTISRQAEEKIELLAEENANTTAEYLNTLKDKASSFADIISACTDLDPETSKNLTKSFFTKTLQDKRIFGIYVAFEPNQFYEDTPDGYSYYAYNSQNGVVYENYAYADYKDIEVYSVPKETGRAHITEPYSWTLTNGEAVWLISFGVPLFDAHQNFIGVATCDVATDTINELAYDMGNYNTAYSYILTNEGNYVVHSEDASKSGAAYAEQGAADTVLAAAANGERKLFEDENQIYGGQAYKIHVPVVVDGVDEVWSSAFVVNKSEVLSSVSAMLKLVAGAAAAGITVLIFLTALFLRSALNPVKSLVDMAQDLESGRLSTSTTVKTKDELGNLSQIFNKTAQTLNGYISEISDILDKISDGDLTVSAEHEYVGDFQPIKRALGEILASLNEAFRDINMIAEQVSAGSSQLASGAQTLASGATEQASALEQLAASLTQVSDDVQRNTKNVELASAYIGEAGAGIVQSNDSMKDLMNAMQGINEASKQISGINKIIDDISFQTNILALNAAVEAARAGSAGKGFAVVAEEVRSLASKSAGAAKQTCELIANSIAAIETGTKLAQATANALLAVEEKAKQVESTNQQIKEASNAQATAIFEIKQGLDQVSSVTQTITATAEENAAASEELSAQAQKLYDHAAKFKTM